MSDNKLEFRQLMTINDLKQMQQIESAVWNEDPVPLHQTITTMRNGGILLGAFDGEKMIGFSYGFPGFKEEQIYLCSHMLGILPNYQQSGIGEQLKLKQAELAREAGFPMITWTFDPLESRNAYFNLHKLRATGATYHLHYYGDMEDGLNKGLPSDRIQIVWDMKSPKREPVHHLDLAKVLLDRDEELSPALTQDPEQVDFQGSDVFFVAIPRGFQTMKHTDFEQAKAWRMQTRAIFEHLFAEGFRAVDLIPDKERSVSYYVFTK